MSIDNHARKTLLVTFTGVAAGDTKNLTSADLGDIFASDDSSGGYTNLTDLQDDFVVVRKFAGNFLNIYGKDSGEGPTADEAWRAWTYPYTPADGVTAAGSGSAMYEIEDGSTDLNLTLVFTTDPLYFFRDDGTKVILPAIAAEDTFYVIRKTKSNNKIVTFEPSARITANNLNTAFDQNFFLGQETEMWFQNYHKLSPAIGKPDGLAPLNSSGQVPNEYLGGYRLSRGSNIDPWDALNYSVANLPTPTAEHHAATKLYVDNKDLYDGALTPQQVTITVTDGGGFPAGEDKTYDAGLTWAQTDEDFFIVAIDGVLQVPSSDFVIPDTPGNEIQILGDTNVGDVISVRNVGRTGINQLDSATVTSIGSTTARSLEDRFADTINIKDFGAVADYDVDTDTGTDNTGAIQAAIDYAMYSKKLHIYLPAGQYLVTGELTWPWRIGGDDGTSDDNYRPSMFGDGGGGHGNITNYSSTIYHRPTSAINCIYDMSGRLQLKDLAIRGNMDADDGTQAGVKIGRGWWDSTGDGVLNNAGGGADALIMNVHVEGCKWGIRTIGNGSDRGKVISCSISKNETGVWLDEFTNNWVFIACTITGEQQSNPATCFSKWGVQVGTAGVGNKPTCCSFMGCNMLRSPLGQLWVQEAAVLNIIGCYFEGGRYGPATATVDGIPGQDEAWYDPGFYIGTVEDTVAPNTIKFAGTPDLSGIEEGVHYLEIKDADEDTVDDRVLHSLITSVDVGNYSVDVEATVVENEYNGMTASTKNCQSSRIIKLSAENWEAGANTTVISRNIIISGCYFNGLYVQNGDADSWIIEYGAKNRVRGLTLLNNTYGNSNQGCIKTSESFSGDPLRIVALNNHSPYDKPFADDYTGSMFPLRLNDSDADPGRCNIWRPVFDERIQIKGSATPNTPPEGSGYLYLDNDSDNYEGSLMFRFDGPGETGKRVVVASLGYREENPENYQVSTGGEGLGTRTYHTNYPLEFTENAPEADFPDHWPGEPQVGQRIQGHPDGLPAGPLTITTDDIGLFMVNMVARVDQLADVLATLIQDTRKGV